jgi:hypothetical protein
MAFGSIMPAGAGAQEKLPDFGNISLAELTMKDCPFEKGAGAMNLIKTATIGFDLGIYSHAPIVTTEYRVRIKLFRKSGFEAANIKIPYSSRSRSTKITDVSAYIYSLDESGKIVREKVEKREIFKEKSKAANAINALSFTFPDLKEGSVLEYRYTKVDKNSSRIAPWLFQDDLPTAISMVSASVPGYATMAYHVVGADGVEKDSSVKTYANRSYNEDNRSFTMRNVRSFRIEPLMTSLKDNMQRVEFSLSPRSIVQLIFSKPEYHWVALNHYLLEASFFGEQFDRPLDGTGLFMDSVRKLGRQDEKIAAIYNYVQRNVQWNDERTFYCDSLEACLRSKSGSSAEMNLLCLNLLRKAGIPCMPVLVSTRDNGNPDQDFPSIGQFNGVDLLVQDSTGNHFIDCTQEGLSFKMPPLNILNCNAYIVDPQRNGWVFILEQRMLMKDEVLIDAAMDTTGRVSGTARFSYIGFGKTERLQEAKDKDEESAKDVVTEAPTDLVMDTMTTEKREEDNDTLVEEGRFHYKPTNTEQLYFLNPFLFGGFKKNPFKDSTRYTDIDFGCNQSYRFELRIRLPANFMMASLPPKASIKMGDSSIIFDREAFMEGDKIIIRNVFELRTTIFFKEDYPNLKTFFDKFYALLNEEVLLKKK